MRVTFVSVLTLLTAINQVAGAAVEIPRSEEIVQRDGAMFEIATSPYYACNCPNNCSHKSGSSCKYYSGPSSDSAVISGTCEYQGAYLNCVGTS